MDRSRLGRRRLLPTRRLGAATLLLLLLLPASAGLVGCAALGGQSAGATRVVPPADASPELEFLGARELELDGRLEEALVAYRRALSKDPDSVYLHRRVAELAARQNRLDEALVHAERAYELDPDDERTRLFLGTLYRLTRKGHQAETVLRGPDGDPINADAALLLFGILTDGRRYDEAEQVADWMVETEPDAMRGYFSLADLAEKRGDPEAAERALRRGLARRPGELAFYGALARSRRDRGDRAGEIEVYDEVLAKHPNHHATLLAKAEAELALGRSDQAVETLERVEAEYPGDLRSALRLAFIEFERGNHQEAADRFERALEANPEQFEVAYFLGIVYRRMQREDQAEVVFRRIPPGHDRYAEARTQLAAIYERRGDYERAIGEVERARNLRRARPLDLYLASLRSKSGDTEGALVFLEGLLDETPEDPEILFNIGVIHGDSQRSDLALAAMERVLEANPDHAGALNYIGYSWAERGENLDQAEAYITRALEIRPDDGYITDSLGWVYYMRAQQELDAGRYREGRELLERAILELERAAELTGGDPVISEHLGDAYRLMDRKRRALEFYEEALALEPRENEQPELMDKLDALRQELQSP